ncbi:MAG: FAD-dependent oxidoreductase [Candidatus Nanoarchaeia archaeon]
MEVYDFLILGAGGTGLAASMYAARLGLKTLILGASNGSELPIGGVITTTDLVENYPGFANISGFELAKKIEEQAKSYKLITIREEKALNVEKKKNIFYVKTNKSEYQSKTILFATGTKWRKLDVPGSIKFENRGVYYCALCDGPLFRDKIVAIIGGSDSAIKDSFILSKYAKKVYVIARNEISAEPVSIERMKNDKKIEMITKTSIKEIKGDQSVKSIILNSPYKGKNEIKLDGLFVAIGHIPISDLAEKLGVKLNDKKEIEINYKTAETNIDGIFAAGDVTDKEFKQLITGIADGCTSAYYAYEYVNKNKS